MTAGTTTVDCRVPEFSHNLKGLPYGQWTGAWAQRVWTGGDSPPRTYTWKYLTSQTRTFSDYYRRVYSLRKKKGQGLLWREGKWIEKTTMRHPRRVKVYNKSTRTPNAYDLSKSISRRFGVHWYWDGNSGPAGRWTTVVTGPTHSTFDQLIPPNKMTQLVAKLGQRANGNVPFNPGIFLGEGKQALRLIGGSAVEIARAISKYRQALAKDALKALAYGATARDPRSLGTINGRERSRRGFKKTPSYTPKDGAQRLLEFQYGIRPLVSDMYEGAQWLASKFHAPKTTRVSVRTRSRVVHATDVTAGLAYVTATSEAKAQLIGYLTENFQTIDLNLVTPAQIAWELMPWSFVIDWALPIGGYLEARGAAFALTGTFVTTKTLIHVEDGVRMSTTGSVQYTKARGAVCADAKYFYIRQIRTVSNSLANNVSFPQFKGFGKTASWEHCLNGVALLLTSGLGDPRKMLHKTDLWARNTPR